MTKKFILLLFFVIIANINLFAQTQDAEMWYKISLEARITYKKFELRYRPIDHTITPTKNNTRMDLILGYKFWKFTLFEYSKLGFKGELWTGPRLDLNLLLADKKLLLHFQEIYFFGLNEKASDHYYLIQVFEWNFNDWLSAGFLGYGKWNTGMKFNEGMWFMGPITGFKLPYNFELELACTKNIFDATTFMTLLNIKYKLKL